MSSGALSPALPIAPGGPQADAMALAMGGVSREGGAEAMPEGGLPPGMAPLAGLAVAGGVLPGAQLDAQLATPNAWTQGHAEAAPWGNPADELVAGGQHRSLAEMARDAARSSTPAAPSGFGNDAASGSERLAAQAPVADAAPLGAGAVARASADGSSLPSGLVPTILTALHTGPARWRRRDSDEEPRRARRPAPPDDEAHDQGQGDDAGGADDGDPRSEALPLNVDAADEPSWGHALVEVLRHEARSAPAQAALQMAAAAWLRGRAVLLACPATPADPSTACLYVLRRRATAEPGASALVGERFGARLRWARPLTDRRWWAVRVAKRHAWPRGGQLVTLDEACGTRPAAAVGRVACEIQLGPIPAAFARWSEVLVRVDAAQRLWAALGVQWSLPLLVCSQALLAEAEVERACA